MNRLNTEMLPTTVPLSDMGIWNPPGNGFWQTEFGNIATHRPAHIPPMPQVEVDMHEFLERASKENGGICHLIVFTMTFTYVPSKQYWYQYVLLKKEAGSTEEADQIKLYNQFQTDIAEWIQNNQHHTTEWTIENIHIKPAEEDEGVHFHDCVTIFLCPSTVERKGKIYFVRTPEYGFKLQK